MQANAAVLSAEDAPAGNRPGRLISIPYLFLRSSTAGAAFAMGLVQTMVFARVLSPDRFSIFIVVGAVGYSLWLCDLGLAKILFVQLRAAHIAGRTDEQAARQASAVILFYVLLSLGGSFACFLVMLSRPAFTVVDAANFGLFFLYVSLNLAWFSLRSISIAIDEFVFYEKLELVRRFGNMATILAMLIGLPFDAFLIGSNLLWAALLAAAGMRLIQRRALTPHLHGFPGELVNFFRTYWPSIRRSGTSALGDLFTYTFPYYVVPTAFGLGAPVIILEATFRIFRGASVIYAAACDLAVPGQTRALAAHDAPRLIRTTLMAAALCCPPAAIACGLLIFAAQPLFLFLLRSAATVPPAVTPILVALLLANLVWMVMQSLMQHTGYFREISRVSAGVAVSMVVATAIAIVAKADIVGFLAAYAAVYSAGSLYYVVEAVRGPIRAAAAKSHASRATG
jgi:O-antigen/teichoic acid export membrane protein